MMSWLRRPGVVYQSGRLCSALCIHLLISHACLAQPAEVSPSTLPIEDLYDSTTRRAVSRGLAYLSERSHADGSLGRGPYARNVGIVGLAGLAFMANGSTPGRGPHGKEVNACLRFVLGSVGPDGFISVADAASHGPMYGHAFATLFLAEAYGMSDDPSVGEKLRRAVRVIVASQNAEGGWRYLPASQDADISVTVCQITALRAASNAGVYVPSDTVSQCVEYVRRCQNTDGGFMYRSSGGQSAFARSAAGTVSLLHAGVYEGPAVEKGLRFLVQHPPDLRQRSSNHFFYGHYYAVQAMWHARGDYWQAWYPYVRDTLVNLQDENGAWTDPVSPEYGTAMATIILQMPFNSLPIFQR